MICSVFEVPNEGLAVDAAGVDSFVPSQKFLEREEEFEITEVDYEELSSSGKQEIKQGIICRRSTDEHILRDGGKHALNRITLTMESKPFGAGMSQAFARALSILGIVFSLQEIVENYATIVFLMIHT